MSAIGNKLRCPHCLEELDHLEDPKKLPCSHVFCSPCLESLTKTEEGTVKITCSICSKCHEVESLVDLPTPETSEHNSSEVINTDTSDDGNAEAKPEMRCDRCKEGTPAVCYCVEYDKSLCPRHEQTHQEFIGEDDEAHKLISTQTYLLKPNYYTKPKCARHKKEYAVSCKRCFRLRCKDCVDSTQSLHLLTSTLLKSANDMHKNTHAPTTLAHNPVHLQFISDDHFVTTDGGTVRMHYMESISTLRLVWECTSLHGVCGVSTTESGLIICLSKGVLYIISAQGKLLNTLHNENIQSRCGQISILGDMLAVPYPEHNKFQLFRLKLIGVTD